jgi:hypothetical protein
MVKKKLLVISGVIGTTLISSTVLASNYSFTITEKSKLPDKQIIKELKHYKKLESLNSIESEVERKKAITNYLNGLSEKELLETADNGTFSDQDSAGNWAGIEVTHSGSTVYYSITY